MKIIRKSATPYGQEDFDWSYVDWGFNDETEQIGTAQILAGSFPASAKRLLDVACGIGRYHAVWLAQGLEVTGTDLSATFIEIAKERNPTATYLQVNSYDLAAGEPFDVVTALDQAVMDGRIIRRVYGLLRDEGHFILESRNPAHPKMRRLREERRDWSREDEIYRLRENAFDPASDPETYQVWIHAEKWAAPCPLPGKRI